MKPLVTQPFGGAIVNSACIVTRSIERVSVRRGNIVFKSNQAPCYDSAVLAHVNPICKK